jgi:hypothetical protein
MEVERESIYPLKALTLAQFADRLVAAARAAVRSDREALFALRVRRRD